MAVSNEKDSDMSLDPLEKVTHLTHTISFSNQCVYVVSLFMIRAAT